MINGLYVVQKYGGKYKSFHTRAPPHLEKLKSECYEKYATGEVSFAPGTVASGSNLNEKLKGLEVRTVEHVGDSDDDDSGGTLNEVEPLEPAESFTPQHCVMH